MIIVQNVLLDWNVWELKWRYSSRRICLTGGEPLIYREKSAALLIALAELDQIEDVHIETNGAINLKPFNDLRQNARWGSKVRFIMDYKLPTSGEEKSMLISNFECLIEQDEVKFVIGNKADFRAAINIMEEFHQRGTILFSPVFETLPPSELVKWILEKPLPQVKLSLQLHKFIWDPAKRGV